MFDVNGKTWHRGTVVLQTTQGERTISHLQSLTFPAVHYYYGRRLDDNEAVGIASAQKGFDPKHLPERPSGLPATGYAGQISEIESLLPMWASMKRGLIQAHLRWGTNPRGPQRQQAEITGTPATYETPPQPDKKREDKRGRNGKAPRRNSPAPVEEPATEPKVHELHPLDNIGARVRLNNQEYKVMIRRVIKSPDGQPARADATYFDETAGVWKEVTDDEARQHLAAQVEAGLLETWQ